MICDMDQDSWGDGLMVYSDYVYGVQAVQLLPLVDTDYLQGSAVVDGGVEGSIGDG